MEHYTKKKRVYITSKSYLKRMRGFCLLLAGLSAVACGFTLLALGITFPSLGIVAGIGITGLLLIRFFWKNARSVSLKAGNIIMKTMSDINVVAPVGSIREVKSSAVLGLQLTRIRYKIDGGLSRFFVFTRPQELSPEQVIKDEIAETRKMKAVAKEKKKEANHKPDSVLTQIA